MLQRKKKRTVTFNYMTATLLILFMVGLTTWYLEVEKAPQLHPIKASVSGEKEQTKTIKEDLGSSIAKLSIPFIQNEGQVDKEVKYYANTFGGTVFVTQKGELVYSLPKHEKVNLQVSMQKWVQNSSAKKTEGVVLKEELTGGSVKRVNGQDKSETKVSYFRGSDPDGWKSGLSTFNTVNLGEVYQGVEVSLRAYGNNVEKLFHVKPGASPEAINIGVTGVRDLKVNGQGELVLNTELGDVKFSKPLAYQEIEGKKVNVEAAYEVKGTDAGKMQYAFNVGEYDRSKELVIDPVLQSTYLGGSLVDLGLNIAAHPTTGDVYVTGYTTSSDFPNFIGGADSTFAGATEAFVSRLASDLKTINQSTYLGGTGADYGFAIAIHPTTGDVYVAGYTDSGPATFPGISGAPDAIQVGTEAFVSRLSSDLLTLNQSTYVGGSGTDLAYGIVIHPTTGDVYVSGNTNSPDLPALAGGADVTQVGVEAFVTMLASNLLTLNQSTYIGGSNTDYGYGVVIHPATGDVYVTGYTDSPNLPTLTGAGDTTQVGVEAFVSRISSTLVNFFQSTYIGGSGTDYGFAIAIHPTSGDVYVTGYTGSNDFPGISGGADTTFGGTVESFVARLSSTLQSVFQSTYLGWQPKC